MGTRRRDRPPSQDIGGFLRPLSLCEWVTHVLRSPNKSLNFAYISEGGTPVAYETPDNYDSRW